MLQAKPFISSCLNVLFLMSVYRKVKMKGLNSSSQVLKENLFFTMHSHREKLNQLVLKIISNISRKGNTTHIIRVESR